MHGFPFTTQYGNASASIPSTYGKLPTVIIAILEQTILPADCKLFSINSITIVVLSFIADSSYEVLPCVHCCANILGCVLKIPSVGAKFNLSLHTTRMVESSWKMVIWSPGIPVVTRGGGAALCAEGKKGLGARSYLE